jgi:hypothetical protein
VADHPDHGGQRESEQERVRFEPDDEIGEMTQHESEYTGVGEGR